LLVALVTCVLELGVVYVWKRASPSVEETFWPVAISTLVFSYFGLSQALFPALDGTQFLALGILCSLAAGLSCAIGIQKWQPLEGALFWAMVALVLAPLVQVTLTSATAMAAEAGERPDVVVLFVDGYAGSDWLEEIFSFDNHEFEEGLRGLGFDVVPNAVSSYSMTYASIASVLDLEYVVAEGSTVDSRLRAALYRRLSDDNKFVAALKDLGYHYTHIESGWGGTSCGPAVDTCVRSQWLDESTWYYLQRTAVAQMMREWKGHAFSQGGLHSLKALATVPTSPQRPDLVVSHVLLPHPPFFVDEGCRFRFDPRLDGLNVMAPYLGGTDIATVRLEAYVQQVECVNRALIHGIGALAADTVVVIIGDHGSDAQGQLVERVEEWDSRQVSERLHTILAVRGCGGETPTATINSLRYLLACLRNEPYSPLKVRTFLVPVEENHPGDHVIEVGLPDSETRTDLPYLTR
jgi:hypothetical protein